MVKISAQFPALISEISAIIGRHRIVVLSAVTVILWRFPITGKNTGGFCASRYWCALALEKVPIYGQKSLIAVARLQKNNRELNSAYQGIICAVTGNLIVDFRRVFFLEQARIR